MGKALYRKYRPKSLDTVVGQEHITNTLKNAIDKGLISHAYLFTGPRGVGKTTVARILAFEINKIPYDEEITQLDIIEIDAASNRRIDEIRDLREKVHIAPTSAKYKVYIIDEVHMLTREAFNALLKTLEEPPAHAIFILATTESHKVPDTIISRTQKFTFRLISEEAISKHLRVIADKENIKISDDALMLLANHGNGSFRDSISMLDQVAGFSEKEITASNISTLLGIPDDKVLKNILIAISENNVDLLFGSIQSLLENGANSAKTAQLLIQIIREDLIAGSPIIIPSKSVSIMKSLLPLTGANSSFEAIEISLLDSIDFIESVSVENTQVDSRLESVQDSVIGTKRETESGHNSNIDTKIDTTEVIIISEDIISSDEFASKETDNESNKTNQTSTWNDVLQALKSKHNTLYGVLRMAETTLSDDVITLTFQFEFHKKQLTQSKNIATLMSIINEHLGDGYSIETLVVKKPKSVTSKVKQTADTDTLSNVSNIFGGAELLES